VANTQNRRRSSRSQQTGRETRKETEGRNRETRCAMAGAGHSHGKRQQRNRCEVLQKQETNGCGEALL